MVAYLTRFGVGFAGAVDRWEQATITPETFNPANMPAAFGIALKYVTTAGRTNIEPAIAAGDKVIGFLPRPYPDIGNSATADSTFGGESPRIGSTGNALKRGFIVVKLQAGDYTAATCLKDTPVYLRTTAATGPARAVGGLADSSGGTGTTLIPSTFFNGPPDAGGFTEIYVNL